MKNYLLIIGLLAIVTLTKAQDKSQFTVTYKEEMKLKIDFSDSPQMEHLKSMIPSSQSFNKELLVKDGKSIYRDGKQEGSDDHDINLGGDTEDGEFQVNIQFDQPNNIIFQDWKNDVVVQKRDFMGRTFLIDGTTEKSWKFTNEEKEIAGYLCKKAILDDSVVTEAWFTPELQAFTGPESFGKLPGLIMEISLEDGRRTITASEIKFEEVTEELVAPTKGKKVTAKKFKQIAEAKVKEMQQEYGGKGNIIMITEDQ